MPGSIRISTCIPRSLLVISPVIGEDAPVLSSPFGGHFRYCGTRHERSSYWWRSANGLGGLRDDSPASPSVAGTRRLMTAHTGDREHTAIANCAAQTRAASGRVDAFGRGYS